MADPRSVFRSVVYEAITPIHVGAGQDVGIVDLPVIRERTSGHPYLPGSGIRGALRDLCESEEPQTARRLFGPEADGDIGAGCLSVLDAHLVLFPVRSDPGVFHWITSPFVLDRWRTLRRYFLDDTALEGGVDPAAPEAELAAGTFAGGAASRVSLEEYPFVRSQEVVWAWPDGLLGAESRRVVLVPNAEFSHFLRHATLVRQRNRLSTAKTVVDGQLFSIEAVPAQARFVGFIGATAERTEGEDDPMTSARALEALRALSAPSGGDETHLVLGGEESIGWGVTRMQWHAAPEAS